jgi:hypothetical protein
MKHPATRRLGLGGTTEDQRQRKSGKLPPPNRADARHEAAHAVVSARCELPLASTSIKRGQGHSVQNATGLPAGVRLMSVGYTTLVRGSAQTWADALPDASARRQIEQFAVQVAAGIWAEQLRGGAIFDPVHRDDLQSLVQIAHTLRIGGSTDDEAVQIFIDSAISSAGSILLQDGGVAWDRVTTALLRKKCLTGAEVGSIIAESDSESRLPRTKRRSSN